MASIILTSVGQSVGNAFLPGIGGQILGQFGRQAGRAFDRELGIDNTPNLRDGPQLENLRVQDSRYGIGLPQLFGRMRVAGNFIWASDLMETRHESNVQAGKGGVVGGGSSRATYSYAVNVAVALCVGPIGGIETIWADHKVIYQNGVWKTGVVSSAAMYNGSATQNADPIMQAALGAGSVPAYRGVAYVVLEALQLSNFGNRLPNLTFEILPANADATPKWLGKTSPNINHRVASLVNKGMAPITLSGSASRVSSLLVGGYTLGATAQFTAVEYDVTGDVPVEITRTSNAGVAYIDISDNSWALAPDGRMVAMYMLEGTLAAQCHLVIYDTQTRQFGTVLTLGIVTNYVKQVAWIDAQHFVIHDMSGGKCGVRVFARAGLNIVDLGFFDVWGAGSASTRFPAYYTQFLPCAGGLLYFTFDNALVPTIGTVRPIFWQNNGLTVGASYTLPTRDTSHDGGFPGASFLRTGDGEYTLCFVSVKNIQFLSFIPGTGSAVITRGWQSFSSAVITTGTCNIPLWYGDRIVVIGAQMFSSDYRLSEVTLNSNSFALTVDAALVEDYEIDSDEFGAVVLDQGRLLLTAVTGVNDSMTVCGILRRRNTGDTLDHVVGGLLQRAGYGADDVDVSALADVTLDGYAVSNPAPAASALAPLQLYAPFDLVESGGKLRAVKHGNSAVAVIPASETRASTKLDEIVPQREEVRAQEMALPVEATVDYLDASRDYEIGTQRARRTATNGARVMAKFNLPLVCSAALAKQIAEARLYTLWAEREHVKLCLSRRWLAVEAGDIIDLGDKLMRVTRVVQKKSLLEIDGVLVPAQNITSAALADHGVTVSHGDPVVSNALSYLMDLPLLRSEDDQPGFYAALSATEGWPGGSLWRAPDGVNYSSIASFSAAAVAGIATTALADAPTYYMDRAGSVYVQLVQGALASCGDADLLNGANVALLGNELIQFQSAMLIAPGFYKLSNLLRGRRGTEAGTATHSAGERFVLLTAGSVQFLPALLTDRNRTYNFRALSNGQSLGDAWDVNFTYALTTLQPLAPTHLTGTRTGGTGSDLTLSWKRRARKNGDWVDNIDVPLDEPSELYDIEIMNGSAVMRTFSSVSTTSQLYSAAQQTSDWGTPPAHYTVNVYQLSARLGRGQKATASI